MTTTALQKNAMVKLPCTTPTWCSTSSRTTSNEEKPPGIWQKTISVSTTRSYEWICRYVKRFNKLCKAYIEARYNRLFTVSKEQYEYMLARTEVLREVTIRECAARLAYYDEMIEKEEKSKIRTVYCKVIRQPLQYPFHVQFVYRISSFLNSKHSLFFTLYVRNRINLLRVYNK